jgi:D-cysteine desulfhydrase family pyridoxal phosphate-dependent enzyme
MRSLEDHKRVELGFVPTPIEPLQRLGSELGLRLFAKRDDFTGFGGGGNKVRKLEYLMADAIARNAKVLITTGGHQSNHARMVAAAACRFGMRAVLVLRGNPPAEYQGNLLLDRLLGAELEFLDPDAYFVEIEPRMEAHAQAARDAGEVPYVIPLGGANPLGALGYVRAVEEMAAQFDSMGIAPPDVILAPTGSGGTLAGLYVGCRLSWPKTRIVGISVSRDARWFQERISVMAGECAALLGPGVSFAPQDIWIEDGFVGTAYGVPSAGGNDAIRLAARREGMLLDPVYTGKAMHGLTELARRGTIARGSTVVFLHCGGSPALYPFAKQLADG